MEMRPNVASTVAAASSCKSRFIRRGGLPRGDLPIDGAASLVNVLSKISIAMISARCNANFDVATMGCSPIQTVGSSSEEKSPVGSPPSLTR